MILGLFYVIDGLLDVSMPSEESPEEKERSDSFNSFCSKPSRPSFSGPFEKEHASRFTHKATKSHKHLFTVKPGGIAGYLGTDFPLLGSLATKPSLPIASLTATASYVDIKAKTDVYVGFLPSHALERLLEKRPIVLLTLAKRLISLLSPLGMSILFYE